ncbi:MAG: hypothetical protein K2N22_03190, partial [Clostridia bacterium]|nr:hypothetical protein [Clostridia bacterium]
VIKEAEGEAAAADAAPAPVANGTAVKSVPVKRESKLLYEARRSVFAYKRRFLAIPFLLAGILFAVVGFVFEGIFFTILGVVALAIAVGALITLIVTFVEATKSRIQFYTDKIIVKGGIFTTHESLSVMTPLVGVSVYQSFGGKIFGYGNILIDKVGRGWDIKTTYIKKPYEVKQFLEGLMAETDYSGMQMHIAN